MIINRLDFVSASFLLYSEAANGGVSIEKDVLKNRPYHTGGLFNLNRLFRKKLSVKDGMGNRGTE